MNNLPRLDLPVITLVALKTGMDIMLHNRSHRGLERTTKTSPTGNTLQGE